MIKPNGLHICKLLVCSCVYPNRLSGCVTAGRCSLRMAAVAQALSLSQTSPCVLSDLLSLPPVSNAVAGAGVGGAGVPVCSCAGG
jgi:hypothetical protein